MSIYSQIYSCKSKNFESKNKYTMERIKRAEELVGDNFIGVFDRGYDDNKIIHYMSRHKFVIRLDDKRNLIFKGKRHSVEEIAQGRKGKIKMKALFDEKEKYEVINNVPKNEEPTDPESTNKKAMADLFKKYAQKVDDYIQVGKYYCVVGELL